MTNIYLDTEFNGFGGKLISMALVPDNGRVHWYRELKLPKKVDPWVLTNVVPYLTEEKQYTFAPFKRSFQKWILKHTDPVIICDWHQDAIFFLELLKGKDYETSLDVSCEIKLIKTPSTLKYKHNALDDAYILKKYCESL